MRTPLAQIVDWATLGEVVVYSMIAGVGITVAYSLGILGAIRFVDMRRENRPLEAGLYGLLMMAGIVATIGALVFGLIVMTSKD